LCVASNIRAMPENEKPPARRVDVYLILRVNISGKRTSQMVINVLLLEE